MAGPTSTNIVFTGRYGKVQDPDLTGKTIAEARQVLGLTQEDLAKRIGMKRVVTISRWENGHRDPNISPYADKLLKIIGEAYRTRQALEVSDETN